MKPVTDGVTLKNLFLLVTLPPGVCTLIVPLEAPFGTVASISVSETTEYVDETKPTSTAVAPVNPVPLITTAVPTGPLVGEKPEMVGPAAATERVEPNREPPATARTAQTVTSRRQRN